ncbi:MAG: type III-A CRISPR-associated protein Csm2 [Actinobacteria bacterium]|nr:type III-A CRISPR-associated protein Csm2 [Actinomycetota bacterium]
MAHQRRERPSVVDEIVKKVGALGKLEELSADDLVSFCDRFGHELKEEKVTNSQIRKVFTEIKHMHLEARSPGSQAVFNPDRVKLLKPKIAYLAAREKKLGSFKKVMDALIDKVRDARDFGRLAAFMEAVIAYHKYHGGKD